MGTRKIRGFGLVSVGVIAGILLSMGITALAQRGSPLPLEVGTEDGMVKVISPIEDTPAARAGIRSGDLISKIDDKSTKGLTLNDAVKLMRGPVKTPITLTIIRQGQAQPLVIKIVRDTIRVRSVRSKMLDDNIGYVRIAQFQEKTGSDLVRHLKDLSVKGAPRALILDMRNDPGGLLNSAIGVSAAFLKPNTLVVSTDGRAPDSKHKYLAVASDYARGESDYLPKASLALLYQTRRAKYVWHSAAIVHRSFFGRRAPAWFGRTDRLRLGDGFLPGLAI